MEKEYRKPSILGSMITIVFIIVVIGYLAIAISTQDMVWAWPFFSAEPYQITIYCYSKAVTIDPRDEAHQELAELVNQTLSGRKRWDQLTMSGNTYHEYQTNPKMVVLELNYDPEIDVHWFYRFYRNVDTLVIPLLGRHANINAIFGRVGRAPATGSVIVNTTAPLFDYVQGHDLCPAP